jgi:hypothetical protein
MTPFDTPGKKVADQITALLRRIAGLLRWLLAVLLRLVLLLVLLVVLLGVLAGTLYAVVFLAGLAWRAAGR